MSVLGREGSSWDEMGMWRGNVKPTKAYKLELKSRSRSRSRTRTQILSPLISKRLQRDILFMGVG